jgi:hypothetical protein
MLKSIHFPIRRVAISTLVAIAAIASSPILARSQNYENFGPFPSMAACRAFLQNRIQALRARGISSQGICSPISVPRAARRRISRKKRPNSLRNQRASRKLIRQWQKGNQFNKSRWPAYPGNEIYIKRPGSKYYYRLDSYNPRTGEIVSRKRVQLRRIQPKTALRYIREIGQKYPPGAEIANVPSVPEHLRGKRLIGQKILEVPVQFRRVPKTILDAANVEKVIVRDINGKCYNLPRNISAIAVYKLCRNAADLRQIP